MIVYRIVNKITNDDYIGKTQHSMEYRLRRHYYVSNQNSQTYLHRAIRKYGINNFIIELIEGQISENLIDLRESYWIEKLKPSYNLTKGGDGGDTSASPNYIKGMKKRSRILTEEHKKNISKGLKRGNHDKESGAKAMAKANMKKCVVMGIVFDSRTLARKYLKDNNIKASLHRRLKDPRYPDWYSLNVD